MKKILSIMVVALAFIGFGLARPVSAETANTNTTLKGTLTAISGVTVPAILTVNVSGIDYTVNVDSVTTIIRKYNGTSALDEFGIGDTVWATGTLSGTTMTAKTLKNISIQRVGGELWGKIISIDATAKTFVFDPDRKTIVNQTVSVGTSTTVFQGNRKGAFGDLAAGMTVKVIGVRNTTKNTIVADRILIKLTELNGTITTLDCAATIPAMTVTVKGGHAAKTWTVNMTATTVIRDKYMHQMACTDLVVGHRVQIRGLKTGTTSLNALQIRDLNSKKKVTKLSGTITSLDKTALTFTLDQKKGDDIGVTLTKETTLVKADGTIITINQLVDGHKVNIWGLLTGTALTANLVMDLSLK